MVYAAAGKGAHRTPFLRKTGRLYRRGLDPATGRGARGAARAHGRVRLCGHRARRLFHRVRRAAEAARAAYSAGNGYRSGDRCAEICFFLRSRGKRGCPERADSAGAAGAWRGVRDIWAVDQAAGAEEPDAASHSEAAVADGAAERYVCARGRAGTARQGSGARPKSADRCNRLACGRLNARGGCGRELSLRAGAGCCGRRAAGIGVHRLRV